MTTREVSLDGLGHRLTLSQLQLLVAVLDRQPLALAQCVRRAPVLDADFQTLPADGEGEAEALNEFPRVEGEFAGLVAHAR